ncbi:MAG: hypothetical protein WCP98_07055 [Actinomycetes bacterium]
MGTVNCVPVEAASLAIRFQWTDMIWWNQAPPWEYSARRLVAAQRGVTV